MATENVERALGRIEGQLEQMHMDIMRLQEMLAEHKDADTRAFSEIRGLVYTTRDQVRAEGLAHLASIKSQIEAMRSERDRLFGAGAAVVAVACFVGYFIGPVFIGAFRKVLGV